MGRGEWRLRRCRLVSSHEHIGTNICDGNNILTDPSGELFALQPSALPVPITAASCERVVQAPVGNILVLYFFDIFLGRGDVVEVWTGLSCYPDDGTTSDHAPLFRLDGPLMPLPFGVSLLGNAVCVHVTFGDGNSLVVDTLYMFRMQWSFEGFRRICS